MTYIYEKKNPYDLYHDLKRIGRDNFSYEGALALMQYLEDMAESTGEPLEYDPIAFCCDYAEYESLEEFQSEYDEDYGSWEDVEDATIVIRLDNEDDGAAIVGVF